MTRIPARRRFEIIAPPEEGLRHLAFSATEPAALSAAGRWDAHFRRRGDLYRRCIVRDRLRGIELRAPGRSQ